MTGPARKLDVVQREQALFRLLRELDEPQAGATVPQIHRALTGVGSRFPGAAEPVRDTVSMPVYYKVVRRLTATGHLLEVPGGPEEGQRYALAPHLHADTALTLEDIAELLDAPPSEAIARLVDAREYVHARRDSVLRDAAAALRKTDARVLVAEMVLGKAAAYNADVALFDQHGPRDERHHSRLREGRAELEQVCYRWFGLSHEAVLVPPAGVVEPVQVDEDELRHQLARRVYGGTVLRAVSPDNPHAPQDWDNVVVAGSDGSTYSSALQIDTAAAFTDDAGTEVVTFNNSVVYLHMEGELGARHSSPWYSVPLTRSAIDSPVNTGMVMAPFMFRSHGLTEGDYEHMAKCATDVVQWRADERVFRGHARALGTGGELPAPRVHLRDGTVTLQERESHHYQRTDPYGEMVREGVRLSHDVLRHIRDRRRPPVMAGAVKGSQLHLFATVINWFIARGHPAGGQPPVDPGWDVARSSLLADNEAMSLLLASAARPGEEGFLVSFVVVRPFHALTDLFRDHEVDDGAHWVERIRRRQADHQSKPMLNSHWKAVEDVEDDPYVRMLEGADYALFYVGHSGGDPAPLLPRYEFLESLRARLEDDAAARVERNVGLVVAALDRTGFSVDREHNFMSRKTLSKHVPFVIFEAHEKCKALCRQLESELKSEVVAQLQRLRVLRFGRVSDVRLLPLPLKAYLERQRRALPPGEEA